MKAQVLLVLAAVVVVAYAYHHDFDEEEWKQFKEKHQKSYKTHEEESHRKKIYHKNKQMIQKHNERHDKGLVTYRMAMNHFGDLHHHERVKMMNGLRPSLRSKVKQQRKVRTPVLDESSLPSSVDWRKEGYVTPIKNQGQCGSCWSFSTTGALEGQHFKKYGKLISLSEQNLVDCSQGNYGCDGGWVELAFEYIKNNGGIDTEASYPYEGVDWNGCRFTNKTDAATDTGYVAVTSGSESALKEAVADVGPISIAMDAALNSFTYYSSGIYYDRECKSDDDDLDHAVLVVGYGTNSTTEQDYWIVKNSWGTTWGEEGYFLLARNKNNTCGVATEADYPTLD